MVIIEYAVVAKLPARSAVRTPIAWCSSPVTLWPSTARWSAAPPRHGRPSGQRPGAGSSAETPCEAPVPWPGLRRSDTDGTRSACPICVRYLSRSITTTKPLARVTS